MSETETPHRFYRRQGALLALLHALRVSDVHFENLIACGDHPVLVDTETILHPVVAPPDSADPAALAFRSSVQRTMLLPVIMVGQHGIADLSGLGWDRGAMSPDGVVDWEFPGTDRMRLVRRPVRLAGGRNRPLRGDEHVEPGEHEQELITGFRTGYKAIMERHGEFLELVNACADVSVRVVARHTSGYATLLDESTHPDLLRDGLDRDRMFDVLWTESGQDGLLWRLCWHETVDLWAGDVPLFTSRPGMAELWTSDWQRLDEAWKQTAISACVDVVEGMSEGDRARQEWIISATLATRYPAGGHLGTPRSGATSAATSAQPERLLAEACGVADQILARCLTDGDRVNWLGVECVDERQWMVLPMGVGLAHGYLGVALFLAQLHDLTGVDRYGDVASRALLAAPEVLDTLGGHPHLAAAIGCGGYQGLGGVCYALARTARLLSDPALHGLTETAAELAAIAVAAPGPITWSTGLTGCLAAMHAVHEETGSLAAKRLAETCADRLTDRLRHADPATVAHGAGFADGAAGVRYAAARFTDLDAAAWADPITPGTGPGWCAGAAGVLAGFADRTVATQVLRGELDRPVLRDLSLCHGELGCAEMLALPAVRDTADLSAVQRRRAGMVLEAIQRHGPACGTPNGVPTPGLFSGLAGIGYGLLRLGFAHRVPSVLLLQPGGLADHSAQARAFRRAVPKNADIANRKDCNGT